MATEPEKDAEDLSQYTSIVPEGTPFQEGFNLKTVWATLFVGFVMLPGAIYLGLVTGQTMAGAAEWVTLILFLEIAKRSFVQLKTQEIMIIYLVAAGLVGAGARLGSQTMMHGGMFGLLMWDQYLIQSPAATGLAEFIPSWVVPPLDTPVYDDRTFVHAAWTQPILVMVAVMVFSKIAEICYSYSMFRVTNDIERLPFPMEYVQARGATALAETSSKQEGWRWRVFSTGTCIGLIWGLIYVVVPTLSGVFLTETVQILPIPFVDFTEEIKNILPAAMFGIGTDLLHILTGMVLPFFVVMGAFIGSVLANLIANPLLYEYGVLTRWAPGMTAVPTRISNTFDFWMGFQIGASVIVALSGFWLVAKAFTKARREKEGLWQDKSQASSQIPENRGDIKILYPILLWLFGTLGLLWMCQILVPEFHWGWVVFFGFIYTPISSYIGARMTGLTGQPYGASIPFLKEAAIILSGYKGAAVWFAPVPLYDFSKLVRPFKQLELTRTKFGSYVKMVIVTTAITFICSFIFWEFIWRLGPVPSSTYPFVQMMWPYDATIQTMWIKSTLPEGALGGSYGVDIFQEFVRPRHIVAGLVGGGVMYLLLAVLKLPTLIFFGIVGGLNQWPHFVLPMFSGALLGRFYFAKRFGEEKWRAYIPIILAGYSCGMGLISMTSIAIALISKAVSQVIY